MDQKLLDALNNLSVALEQLNESLDKSGPAKTDTGTALQSGNFGDTLKEINVGIKSIKDDTKKILDNQETLIKMQKEQSSSETKVFEEAGGGKTKQMIKDGVAVIALIAGAVLAIGLAFKLVGGIDFATVIGLSIAIPMIALAFKKVSEIEGLDLGLIGMVSLSMIAMSAAIMFSSFFLSNVSTISLAQSFSIILIGITFAVVSFSLGKLVNALGRMNPAMAVVASFLMPIVLVGLSYGIMLSSSILSQVQPIGLAQAITSILIAGVFAVISFSIGKLVTSLGKINPAMGLVASFLMPIVLVGISYAIMASSEYLNKVQPIGFAQAISSIVIAGIFVILSYAVKPLMKGISGVNFKDVIMGTLIILALTGSIVAASYLISEMNAVDIGKLLSFGMLGIVLGITLIPMAFAIKMINTIGGPSNVLKGAFGVVVIAAAISASSVLLSFGNYGSYPNLDWSIGVGLSLLSFGISTLALGTVITLTGGLGVVAIVAGAAASLLVAGTIVGVAEILSAGNFSGGPSPDWSIAVGGALVGFATAVVILGVINSVGGLAETLSLGAVKNPIEAGSDAVITIANTMNKVGEIVSTGNYTGGPTKEWSEGISLALGAFSPIYSMMVANKVMTSLFGSGVSVDDFSVAIDTISKGIVSAANFFKGMTDWKGGPTKEWSEGVGGAIAAFAPVYEILAANSGFLSSGIKPEDFAGVVDEKGNVTKDGAIQVIAKGIVSAAKFFGENTAVFDISKAPSKEWSESVGGAIGAFAPVFELLSENSGVFGDDEIIQKMRSGIISISSAISRSAFWLGRGDYSKYPTKEWTDSITYTIEKLSNVKNINSLTRTFSRLGSSMKSFSNSVADLDLTKLEAVKSLSGSVVMLSLLDADNFDAMMTKIEERGGIFKQLIEDFETKKSEASTLSIGSKKEEESAMSEFKNMNQKLDNVTAILTQISGVVSGDLRTYLLENTSNEKTFDGGYYRSDKRLKNIIKLVGRSDSGINIYQFTYKFNPLQIYEGVIAQELINTEFEDSLILDKNGYYSVDYSKLDVDFKKLNKV